MAFIEVRDEVHNKLLFLYDPERDIIEIQNKNQQIKSVVHLKKYRKLPPPAEGGSEEA